MPAYYALLPDRASVFVSGVDAETFLHSLLTNRIPSPRADSSAFAALLSPQGKVLYDMIISRAAGGFLLDCRRDYRDELIGRLGYYQLRTRITLARPTEDTGIVAVWGDLASIPSPFQRDPRSKALGWRAAASHIKGRIRWAEQTDLDAYHAHRIACGVPEGGLDFAFGTLFPHEASMDHFHGLSFDKGCYIGQEVVSRVHHLGAVRKRIVPFEYEGSPPPPGSVVMINDRRVGLVCSSSPFGQGLALLRLNLIEGSSQETPLLTASGSLLRLAFHEEES